MAAPVQKHSSSQSPMIKSLLSKISSYHGENLIACLKELRNYIRGSRGIYLVSEFRRLGGNSELYKLLKTCLSSSQSHPVVLAPPAAENVGQNVKIDCTSSYTPCENTQLIDEIMSIVGTCCREPATQDQVVKVGFLSLIGKILRKESDASVINRTSRTIGNLAKNKHNCELIHKQDYIPCLLKHLEKIQDTFCRQSIVRSIKILANSTHHSFAVIKDGGIRCLFLCIESTDQDLIGITIETLAKLTDPLCYRELKKPTWNSLWEDISSQLKDKNQISLLIKVMNSEKQSIKDQALILLTNLTNSETVRLLLGQIGQILLFVEECKNSTSPYFNAYLHCLSACCKESVNRVKVKECNGLDVLLDIITNQDKEFKDIALSGLINFYHDNPSLRYLCLKGLINSLSTYLEDEISKQNILPSYAAFMERLNDFGPEVLANKHDKFPLSEDYGSVKRNIFNEGCDSQSHADNGEASTLMSNEETFKEKKMRDRNGEVNLLSTHLEQTGDTLDDDYSPEDDAANDEDLLECSVCPDQSVSAYSPPRVDWSDVFEKRLQWGHPGMSPSSDFSSYSKGEVMHQDLSCDGGKSEWSDSVVSSSDDEDRSDSNTDDETVREDNPQAVTTEEIYSQMEKSGLADSSFTQNIKILEKRNLDDDCWSTEKVKRAKLNLDCDDQVSLTATDCTSEDTNSSLDLSEEQKHSHYAMNLLSKCSCLDSTVQFLAQRNVIRVLLKWTVLGKNLSGRSFRILMRVFGSRVCFENLIVTEAAEMLSTAVDIENDVMLDAERKYQEETPGGERKESAMEDQAQSVKLTNPLEAFSEVALSGYGYGVLVRLLNKKCMRDYISSVQAIIKFVGIKELEYLICQRDLLSPLFGILQEEQIISHDYKRIVKCIRHIARIVGIKEPQPVEWLDLMKCTSWIFQSGHETKTEVKSQATEHSCEYASKLHDIDFVLEDGSTMKANKDVLCQSSEYFSRLLEGHYEEAKKQIIEVKDVAFNSFEIIVHYASDCKIQTCKVLANMTKLCRQECMDLIAVTGCYLMPELQQKVALQMRSHFDIENIIPLCSFASQHGALSLKRDCLCFMLINNGFTEKHFLNLRNEMEGNVFLAALQKTVEDTCFYSLRN